MPNCADATPLSPEERLREVATILANGVLRLRQRATLPPDKNLEISERMPPQGLELSGETRLSVLVG